MKTFNKVFSVLILTKLLGHAEEPTNTVYFVFGEPAPLRRAGFVLPLTRSNDIAHVRAWMKDLQHPPGGRSIPLFRIAAGADGINRNYLVLGAPLWSWHVVEFVDFNAGIVGTLGISADYVEQNLDEWLQLFHGYTAFFQEPLYELSPRSNPVVSAHVNTNGLNLEWTPVNGHYLYSIEQTGSASLTNWIPAPDFGAPRSVTNWTVHGFLTNKSRFFRVKAELRNPEP